MINCPPSRGGFCWTEITTPHFWLRSSEGLRSDPARTSMCTAQSGNRNNHGVTESAEIKIPIVSGYNNSSGVEAEQPLRLLLRLRQCTLGYCMKGYEVGLLKCRRCARNYLTVWHGCGLAAKGVPAACLLPSLACCYMATFPSSTKRAAPLGLLGRIMPMMHVGHA
eukprot:2791841-Amphidinium_carterae.1